MKLVLALQERFYRERATMHLAEVNGETGLLLRVEGELRSAMAFTTDGERILAVHAVVNPDKLPAVRP